MIGVVSLKVSGNIRASGFRAFEIRGVGFRSDH